MYLSHRGLTAIHQERVDSALARSKQQRMLKAAKQERDGKSAAALPRQSGGFRGLVATLNSLISRPSES